MQSPTYRSSWFFAAVLAFTAAPAYALAVFEINTSGIRCGITDSSGTTTLSDCTSLSFAVTLQPGQSAFVSGTLTYHYTDDGLPIRPTPFPLVEGVPFREPITFEAGIIRFSHNCADARACAFTVPPTVNFGFSSTPNVGPELILGFNQQSDDITGSIDVLVTASQSAATTLSYSTTLFFGAQASALSAPAPEPATIGPMASGLLLGGALRRRRKT